MDILVTAMLALSSLIVPVIIFIFGKINKDKPLKKFLNIVNNNSISNEVFKNLNACLKKESNLFILTNPKVENNQNTEIEELFLSETLNVCIDGKKFSLKENYDSTKYYGKDTFSKFVLKNYSTIDFSNFVPMLDALNNIVLNYNKKN